MLDTLRKLSGSSARENTMILKYYCEDCGTTHTELKSDVYNGETYFYCPVCENVLFETIEEMLDYFSYPDTTSKVPFERSTKMKLDRKRE